MSTPVTGAASPGSPSPRPRPAGPGPVRTTSLRLRVVVAVLAVLVAVLAVLGLLVNAVLAARLHGDLRDRLTERAGFARLLADRGLSDQELADRLTGQGITAAVRDGGTEVYGRSRPGPGRPRGGPRPQVPAADPAISETDGLLTARLPLGSRTLTLQASRDELDHTLAQLHTIELIAGAVTVLVAGLLLLRVVSTALAPLDRMTALAGRIARGGRGERLRPSRPGTDLGRTAVAFDGMLDALEASAADARSAEARMRRFLGDASHDLRTPVATLLAASESLLRDDPGRAERERRLVAMVREARRAGRLVDDLLLMTRLDGLEEPRWAEVDVAELAREVAAGQRLLAPDADIAVDAAPARTRGDREQLARLLTNLGDNARRAAGPTGRIRLTVRNGDGVRVEVSDDGPGVPAGQQEAIFDRFVRFDGQGHGLGLPIARAVARRHGGDLTCEPTPAGATFLLVIPGTQTPGPSLGRQEA